MQLKDKIYIAGHRGMVGSAMERCLRIRGYENIVTRTHEELDLTCQKDVEKFFNSERPDHVILAAAKVGGIMENDMKGGEFIYQNTMISTNVIHSAYTSSVRKLLFLGSSCIYPKFASQPIDEAALLTGHLESTNEAYAISKIAGIKMCAAYNRQYGTNFISVMPSNLYGIGDNYDLQSSHVLPALIHKIHQAKMSGSSIVTVWGTGRPKREFLYSDDLADACIFLMENYTAADIGEIINIGTGNDLTIGELAQKIADIIAFDGKLVFDVSKPDGTPRKVLDVSRLKKLGWSAKTSLDNGINLTYKDFFNRFL